MKIIKSAALAALLSTSFLSAPALADTVTPAAAATADGTTLAAMQTQCDALAAAHDTANGDVWTGEVVEGTVTLIAGPTEVGGTRDIDESSIVGTGTYVPGALYIDGNPFRTGGSVNMFGDQWSSAGYYPDSTYNFTADFTSTFAHAFSCNINDAVYHAAVFHPAVHHPVEGYYVVDPDGHGNEEAAQNGCNAFNNAHAAGEDQGFWGNSPQGNCIFNVTQAAYDDAAYTDPAYNDEPVFVVNEAGTAVNQDQTDNLSGFEDHGGVVQVTGAYHVGQVVICISPGSKGGSWRLQNGYTGSLCTTTYFKTAPYGSGSQTSNGTFISVPNYSL